MAKIVEDNDVASVALAALTKMVSLLAAELVVGEQHGDMDRLEFAMRAKLFATVDGVSAEATAKGVALAHQLINPVLHDLRARVEAKKLEQAGAAAQTPGKGQISSQARKLH